MVNFIWDVAAGLLGIIACGLFLSIIITGIINSITSIVKKIKKGEK